MRKGLKLPIIFVYSLLVLLLIYFSFNGNYEFSGYGLIVGLLFYLIIFMDKYYNFPIFSIWLFAIWVALHMLGGSIYIGGTRLYGLVLIPLIGDPFFILRYDQLIHAFCYFTFTILVYFVLKKYFKKGNNLALIVFSILASIGIGLLNEVMEFGMVIFADAAEAVGGYYNTALDLVFNLIGAIIGGIFIHKYDSRRG